MYDPSANQMNSEEDALRQRIARDLRAWAVEQEFGVRGQHPNTTLIGMRRPSPEDQKAAARALNTAAMLVEGGYRGNCSACCDHGAHRECKRPGCSCECHCSSDVLPEDWYEKRLREWEAAQAGDSDRTADGELL